MPDTCREQADVCVMGAGPAGSSTALQLAKLGHRVTLIEQSAFPRSRVGESLTPGILPLLDLLGVREEVEAAGFLRPQRSIIFWSRDLPREQIWGGNPGFQVDRSRFDSILLAAAQTAGVKVIQPATAGRPGRTHGGWEIPVITKASVAKSLRCSYLVDATGKYSAIAGPRRRAGPDNLAIYSYWKPVGKVGIETRIEAGPESWYWGALMPDGIFNATVVVDRGNTIEKTRNVTAFYHKLISRSVLLGRCLRDATGGPVKARDATMSWVDEPVTNDLACVGAAALSLDPLSSQGIQSAIRGALQTAVAINTILTRPERTVLAVEFCRNRHTESIDQHRNWTAMQYRNQKEFSDNSFWAKRSRETPAREKQPGKPPRRLDHAQVVRLAKSVQTLWHPCLEETLISSRIAARTLHTQSPVAWIAGIPVTAILNILNRPIPIMHVRNRLFELRPPNSESTFVDNAISTLWSAGFIETVAS